MVTEELNKVIVSECQEWYSILASHSEKINKLKKELYFFAPGKTDHDVQLGIEHFHNQIHIQLINIHDLKPVSYTHLDVYKRQAILCSRRKHCVPSKTVAQRLLADM